jgi:hypothetical protein
MPILHIHPRNLPKSPPTHGKDAWHSSAQDCKRDGSQRQQQKSAHLSAAFEPLRDSGFGGA